MALCGAGIVTAVIPERARPMFELLEGVSGRFSAAGFKLYLVGGVVRDLLMPADADEADHSDSSNDLDLTTDASPAEIKRLLEPLAEAIWTQGERFGTIGAQLAGETIEITTHRTEVYDPQSRKPKVSFTGTDLRTDLSRRDFTINAMAIDLGRDPNGEFTPELVDPFGGVDDLLAKRLRTPIDPEVSFADDPLRMMRAARFIARFDLSVDEALITAVGSGQQRLGIVSAERIRDELCKLVVVPDPSAGLWFLYDTGLSDTFMPELSTMRVEQDPIHRHKDVLSHTIAVVAKAPPELLVRLSALFHDIGKPKTKAIGANGVSFHHHEVVGARMTRKRMREMKFSNEMVDEVSQLVYLHLRMHTYQLGWTDSAVRRFVRDAGELLPELLALTRSDCTTRNKRKADALERRIDELEDRIKALAETEELAAIRPDLNGNQVMTHLGIKGGPEVGEALDYLLELRLENGPLEQAAAYEAIERWWSDREQ